MSAPRNTAAVLLDLDGTLVDSAPDLLTALDHVRAGFGLPPCDHQLMREHVSRGAGGLLEAGLPEVSEAELEDARETLLDYYGEHYWVHSAPFAGIEALLGALEQRGMRLGIVTNKISRFATPIVAAAGWQRRFGCLVAGDQVARTKPDPEPVLAACQALGVGPGQAVFVGDDHRDVVAGRAAGTRTVVAAWGYLPTGAQPRSWNADGVIDRPCGLLELLAAGSLS